MANSGLKINKTSMAKLGNLSTQAIPIESSVAAVNAISAATLAQQNAVAVSATQEQEKNNILLQALPLLPVNQNTPIQNNGIGNLPKNISSTIQNGLPSQVSRQNIEKIDLKNPILNSAPRVKTFPIFDISKDAINSVKKTLPPKPDTLKLSNISIVNDNFENTPNGGISSFRPEILGVVNFNPIFWPENKSEFTEAGQFIAVNYQNFCIRKTTIDKIFEKIKSSGDTLLINNLSNVVENSEQNFSETEKILGLLTDNYEIIGQIKKAFEVKEIEENAYKTNEFESLKNFFERKMQFSEKSFNSFSDTKILMQILFDLRSALEGYSFSLLNLVDEDRKNDFNPILLDKTYTRTSNFTFSIDSIKSTGVVNRLSFESGEFVQFINSLPTNLNERTKLLIHLLNKELRVSRGLSKSNVRNLLKNYYNGSEDGNPFDNVVGHVGSDIFENVLGDKSLSSLLQLQQPNYMVLPFENKTVDDSQTTYVPGSRYFGDSLLNLVNGNFNIRPFNNYQTEFSDVLAKAKTIINEIFEFNSLNSPLRPDNFILDFLQSTQDGLSSLAGNSEVTNSDQLIFAALLRLSGKDNTLKHMLFQYFLLAGISSNNKLNKKKIFSYLVDDVKNDIKKFSYVKVNSNEIPDLTLGLHSTRPYLEKLAIDIENRVFDLINPRPNPITEFSPIVRSATAPFNDKFFAITNKFSKLPFGATVNGSGGKRNASIVTTIQDRTANTSINVGAKLSSYKTPKTNIYDKGTIKNVLLNSLNATAHAGTNILKEYIDFSDKLDKNTSIQGNQFSYLLENNSTRFNYVSTSYLLLFLFEIYSSFVSNFFVADFVDTSDYTKIVLSFDQAHNEIMLGYVNDITPDKKQLFIEPLTSELFKQNLTPNPPQIKKINISPAFLSVDKTSKLNVNKNAIDSLNQMSMNVFSAIGTNNSIGTSNSKEQTSTTNSVSMMLETISNMSNKKSNGSNGSYGQKIGFAGGINRDFQSRTVGIESIKNSISTGNTALNNIGLANIANIDISFFRKMNSMKDNLLNLRKKINEEDLYIRNVLHIFDVVGDRMALVKAKVNSSLSKFQQESIQYISEYKETAKQGQLKAANWIFRTYKENSSEFGSFNSIYKDEYFALISLLADEFYTKSLANSRVKLLAIGIPNGFGDKLIDRVSKNEITAKNFRDLESDIISISVYRKNNMNDDIIYYPQKFTFDLSLFPKELNGISIDPRKPLDRQMDKISLLDFEDLSNQNGIDIDLSSILSLEKYDFLNQEEKKEMFKNHVVSYLLQTYTYLSSGFSFSEEIFPIFPYEQMKPNILTGSVENLIRAYFKLSMGFDYPSARPINQILTDSTVPDDIKDDIQLILYGSNVTRPELVKDKTLKTKKFDRVFFLPINIDDFIVDVDQTLQTTSGKRMFGQSAYQNSLIQLNYGNNKIFKEDRENKKDPLIFDDMFVTIESVRRN